MAEIVGGFALSHGPQSVTPADKWALGAADDEAFRGDFFYRGRATGYGNLLALRAPGFAEEISAAKLAARYDACQRALEVLAQRFRELRADVAIVFGNDQDEIFRDRMVPAVAILAAGAIDNIAPPADVFAGYPERLKLAWPSYCPPQSTTYPGAPDLAGTLAGELAERGFDVAVARTLPRENGVCTEGIPHAFGYVYRMLMEDRPPPTVPVFLNVGVAPNIIRGRRCLELGRALHEVLAALPSDARVAVVTSGGLSHITVDEELDRRVIAAMQTGDEAALAAIPETFFLGNTCEIKNWYPTVAIMNALGKPMQLVDYVPCYRTPAGTGQGMAFAYWS